MVLRKVIYLFFFALFYNNLLGSSLVLKIEDSLVNSLPVIENLYVLEDKNHSYSFDDLIVPPNNSLFKLNEEKDMAFGFTNSSYWFRFSLLNESHVNQELLLVIGYPLIKEIDFFELCEDKLTRTIYTGDNRAFSTRDIAHRKLVFKLTLERDKLYTYYIKANNHGETLKLPLNLYNYSAFEKANDVEDVIIGIFYGLVIFVIVFSLFLYYSMGERLYVYYAFYVIFLTLFLCNLDGISFQYLWPNSPWFGNHSTIVAATMANFFLLLFSRSFLSTWEFAQTFDEILKVLLLLALFNFALAFFDGQIYLYAVIGVNFLSVVSIFSVVVAAFYSISSNNKSAYYFVFSFFVFMISVFIYVLRNIGICIDNVFTTYILKLGFTAELILITFAITDRFRRLKDSVNQDLENVVQAKANEIKSQNEEVKQQSEYLIRINEELKLLSAIVSETDNGITIFSKEGIIEWQNKGYERVFGYSYMNKLLLKSANAFELSENEHFASFFQKAIESKRTVSYKTNFENRFGKNIWVQTTLTPILDEEKSVSKLIAIDSDITEVKTAEEELKRKNLNVTTSIKTAQQIQKALSPPKHFMSKLLPESFVLLKPKDIVSGDFYWVGRKDHNIFFAAVDCTGHGVPGAFMSIVGVNLLNQAIKEKRLTKPSDILSYMNLSVNRMLRQGKYLGSPNEGMDMAVCVMNFEKNTFQYAGAKNPIYIVRDKSLLEIKGDRHSVGIIYEQEVKRFTNHEIDLRGGDTVYLFSDGFADQFGGEFRKKYMRKNFKQLFLDVQGLTLEKQKLKISEEFDKWKGDFEQIDDVLVMGVKF